MIVDNLLFTAVIVEEPKGGYSAYIEEIPGANTQGETLDEVRENLKEALALVLDTNKALSQKQNRNGLKSYRETIRFAG